MRFRAVAIIVGLVVLGAGCSSDESSDPPVSSDPAASMVVDPDTGVLQPLVETGTLTITVVAADDTSPITVADRLDQMLAAFQGAKRASVADAIVTGVANEVPRDEALAFEFTMRPEPIVALHPVLSCADDGGDPATPDPIPGGAVVLSGDMVGECVLGPSPFDRTPFTDAFVIQTLDIQVSVDVDPEQIDQFNELTRACYDTTELCPSQQIALVADGKILTAPTVNIAEFPTTLSLTGDFTVESAGELADSIVLDRFTGEFVSAEYDFAPDA